METGSDIHITESFGEQVLADSDAGRLHVSLVASPGIIQEAVLDVIRNEYLYIASHKFEGTLSEGLHDFLRSNGIFSPALKRIQLTLAGKIYTLVPGAFYSTQNASDYLSLTFSDLGGNPTHQDRLKNFDIQNIYPAIESIDKLSPADAKEATVRHHISNLLDNLHLHFRSREEPLMILHRWDSFTDIIILEGRQLRFCNTFNTSANSDVLYHALLVMEQCALRPAAQELLLAGDFNRGEELFNDLRKQIPGTHLIKAPINFSLSPSIQELPLSKYYLLLHQYRNL